MAVRSATINLTLGGSQNPDNSVGNSPGSNNLTLAYSLASSAPPTTAIIVQPDGDIDLTILGSGPGWSPEADVYFNICGQILGTDGNYYTPRWAAPTETSGNPKQVGFCWLVVSETDDTVVAWPPGMATRQVPPVRVPNRTQQVLIDDNRQGGNEYVYCLGVCFDKLPGHLGTYYYVTFDPKLVVPS